MFLNDSGSEISFFVTVMSNCL